MFHRSPPFFAPSLGPVVLGSKPQFPAWESFGGIGFWPVHRLERPWQPQPFANKIEHHLVGDGGDAVQTGIAPVALHVEFHAIAVAAKDLHAAVRRLPAGMGSTDLGLMAYIPDFSPEHWQQRVLLLLSHSQ